MCTKNYDQMMYGSSDMVSNGRTDGRTDGQTDGPMEKMTLEVGAPPKKPSQPPLSKFQLICVSTIHLVRIQHQTQHLSVIITLFLLMTA